MVTSHKRQGLLAREVLLQSTKRIAVKGAIGERYRELFVDEVRNQFETAD
jgi:hypothetical protein